MLLSADGSSAGFMAGSNGGPVRSATVRCSPIRSRPHTLDNLNGFLKRRPAYRSYGVSVPLIAGRDTVRRPATASPFMQFEYRPRDPEKFRTILPTGVETLRVHTVDEDEPRFLRLLEHVGSRRRHARARQHSFNGFHEPLVCSPRDAIRVFYGTGLDSWRSKISPTKVARGPGRVRASRSRMPAHHQR